MRVFIAINLSADVRARLDSAAAVLRESEFPVRWVPAANVHLTLKFLGEVDEARVAAVNAAVDAVARDFTSFELVAGGFGAFPSPGRPQVLWVGVEASPTLGKLQAMIEGEMEKLGFPREKRAFHPHLTLGRARKGAARADFRGLAELMNKLDYREAFPVRSIDVMRSKLTPGGANYSVLHSARLEA